MEQNLPKLLNLMKIITLLNRPQGVAKAELVKLFGVSERTVFRYLENLRDIGLPVWFDETAKRYRLMTPYAIKPLQLLPEEATAMLWCLKAFEHEAMPFRQELRQAQLKVIDSLPADLQKLVQAKNRAVSIRVAPPPKLNEQIFTCLEEAVRSKQRVKLQYYTANQDEVNLREIDPYVMSLSGRAWFIVGFCHIRQSIRTFRADRISEAVLLQQTFTVPAGFDPVEYFPDYSGGSWQRDDEETIFFRVRFANGAGWWLKDTVIFPGQEVIDDEDGDLYFSATVTGVDKIIAWVLNFGADAEVLEPDWLRHEMRQMLQAMTAVYK